MPISSKAASARSTALLVANDSIISRTIGSLEATSTNKNEMLGELGKILLLLLLLQTA